jgi:hypothetical protein
VLSSKLVSFPLSKQNKKFYEVIKRMDNQSGIQSQKLKPFPWKRVAIGGCFVIALCLLSIIGLFLFALRGGGGEPASLAVPVRVNREFVQAIHNQQIDVAYTMLSEKFSPKISKEQFALLTQKDQKIFSAYKKLDVCDWGFFISDGRVITSSSLLYYEGGVIVVEVSLHKDADSVWRVQGFRFRPDVSDKTFGLCK